MMKVLLILAALGCLGWLGYQELDLGKADVPATPSVGYPTIDGGGGVGGAGDKTSGLIGP